MCFAVDSRFTIAECADQGLLADQIDESHDAAGIAVNQLKRFVIENLAVLTACNMNSPRNIFLSLKIAKWQGCATQGDALPQLPKRRAMRG